MALRFRRRRFSPGTPRLALRGAVSVVVAGAVAALLVGRATGSLDPTGDVFVGVPVSAGLITTQSPVRYHGVNVGTIAEIESGTQMSQVRLAIDRDSLPLIPDSVVARIVPRTFFGDIYLQLADHPDRTSDHPLAAGDTISVDDSADAMALYDVFTKIVDVFSTIKPEKMQTALTAVSQALRDRGSDIGATIDNLSAVSGALTPTVANFLDTTPQFRDVMESLHTATPGILTTLSSVTGISNRMVDDEAGFGSMMDALAGLGPVLTPFLADHHEQLITVLDAGGKVLAATAAQPYGLVETLDSAEKFGDAGARTFASGKFNITAVATFSGPMPYTAADCPVYGTSYGAYCGHSDPLNPAPVSAPAPADTHPLVRAETPAPETAAAVEVPAAQPESRPSPAVTGPAPGPVTGPAPGPAGGFAAESEAAPASAVVGGAAENHALGVLENEFLGRDGRDAPVATPNIATVVMLGPLVRGTEVRVG